MLLRMKRPMKWAALTLIALIILLPSLFGSERVYAEDKPEISIKKEFAYGDKVKLGRWNPVKLTLTSNQDISGDIVIQVSDQNYNGSEASYVQHVELPKDTPKEVTIAVPGGHFSNDNNEIKFYQDSIQKGKVVEFSSGTANLYGIGENSSGVGVLSEDPDAMNFLNVLTSSGYDIEILPLKVDDIPEQSLLLDRFDVLVINRFASDTLSKEQAQAITDWVKSGGTLLLGGGASFPKTSAAFTELSPVEYTGTFTVSKLSELEKLGGKKLELGGEITLSDAEALAGTDVMVQTEGRPLIASHEVEQGKVLYAAYDLAMDPMASWSGHPAVWSAMLGQSIQMPNTMGYMPSYMYSNSLTSVLDYFPSLKLPSFSLLIWMLIVYVVIVSPLLYLILRKVDKREWAWWIIPLIAVVASASIYFAGSSDKTREMAHTINIVEMDGKGSATQTTASAFFTPKSGKYNLEFPKGTYLTVQRNEGAFGSRGGSGNSIVRVEAKGTELQLRGMPQWSLAKMNASQRKSVQVGNIDVQISQDDQGNIVGQVTNQTGTDLTRVVLVLGGQIYEVGDLENKESRDLSKLAKPKSMKMGNLGGILYPYPSRSGTDSFNRERDILMNYAQFTSWYKKGSFVIGWSHDNRFNYTLNGKEMASYQLNLWTQPVTADWVLNGKRNIPYGFITPNISQVASSGWYQDMNGNTQIESGTVTFEYEVPDIGHTVYDELSLKTVNPGKNTEYRIWNYEKQDWDPVEWNANKWKAEKDLSKYMAGGNIRMIITAKESTGFMLPDLALKGVVKP